MAETLGSLIDKICIAELKIYHTQEQVDRTDVTEEHRQMCRNRLSILNVQRDDLSQELNTLSAAWSLSALAPAWWVPWTAARPVAWWARAAASRLAARAQACLSSARAAVLSPAPSWGWAP